MSTEELRIERSRYNLLVDADIRSMKFNEDIHKKIRNFIYFTVIIGGIVFWAGASSDSNVYILLYKHFSQEQIRISIPTILLILLTIPVGGVVLGMKNSIKKLSVEYLLDEYTQNKIFNRFVKMEIEKREGLPIGDMMQLSKIISRKEIYDIEFNSNNFEEFATEYLEKYKVKFPVGFHKNYIKLILLNQCIEGILVKTRNNIDIEYTLIIDNNYSLFNMI
ncbi:hypothetical protein [Tissierella sp. Yu-01]|uniref:hypothetical protein n=1 Tax=Tissierella sp. Yu-01 TaxID=3035694 RepID=UPI00240D6BBB|nr:hypothetical protein [Tissierella sp. Yu-01]WFA10322.1 hypothetical protein P3962_07160 [Tissierella sp. Yu-01]